MSSENKSGTGRVVQVIGPVLDIQFEQGHLPAIFNAVRVTSDGFDIPEPLDVTVEVHQHRADARVRAVAREPAEGMVRAMRAIDSGESIKFLVVFARINRLHAAD